MKVVAYLRVSTAEQAENGDGLGVQRDAIEQWAAAHSHVVVSWHVDAGRSGSNGIETREALGEALVALQDEGVDGFVVYKLDRLARDLVVQETLLGEVKRLGAEAFSTSAAEAEYISDNEADPTRALIRQILGAVSQYERSMIKLRLAAGRKRKGDAGGYAYGAPPFGWRAVAGELVELPEEQAVIRRIVALRNSGLALRAIAEALNDEGYRSKSGVEWQMEPVRRILKREGQVTSGNE